MAALSAEKEEIALKTAREQVELAAKVADLQKRLDEAMAARQAAPPVKGQAEEKREELHAAEQELQKVREELGTLQATLKNAMESLKHAKDEARQARKDQKQHRHENEALQGQLKAVRAELHEARRENEAVRFEFYEAGKSHETALRELNVRRNAAETALQAELAELKDELERVTGELAGSGAAYSGETELLRAALAEAHAALSVEKAKNESALLEMDALERNASGELKTLKKKVDTLTAEKRLLEKIATEIKNRARGEIERQQQINRSQRAAALQKLQALQEEIRQLAEARAAIASPTGVALTGTVAPALPADTGKVPSLPVREEAFNSGPFGSYDGTGSCTFQPDISLKGIPCSEPENVVEVYRSYNTIHAAPSGKKAQRCDGFVCLVTEGERSIVYVAWLMNGTGEVLVCLPDGVVGEGDSCQRLLREGVAYFERIGFMIDRLPLEADPNRRRNQLDQLGIFSRTVAECAA